MKFPDQNHDAFFEKHKVTEEERQDFVMTMLQKVAKSTCIIKTTYVLDKICDARNMLAVNIYYCELIEHLLVYWDIIFVQK